MELCTKKGADTAYLFVYLAAKMNLFSTKYTILNGIVPLVYFIAGV